MNSKIFNINATDHLLAKMFLDPNGGPKIARYEQMKYSQFDSFTDRQLSFFWRPSEIDLSKDKLDFRALPHEQQHIFTSNLFRQIILDSIQGRGPNLMLLPICSLPELEGWIENWGANETIHSRSYTHIIRNIYSQPSEVFDEITKIPEIMECVADVSKYYDKLSFWNTIYEVSKLGLSVTDTEYDEYEHKKAIWLCINSINILEGIRFYISFTCSWNFAENKKMEGNAKIIRLIGRDENLHLGSTQYLLRTLPKDDPDFIKIRTEMYDEVRNMFVDVIIQEKKWAKYLFQHGSMIGLSEEILGQYVDYIASKRMKTLNIEPFDGYPKSDPLPWTKDWISSRNVQVASQEVEVSSYLISDIEQNITDNFLSNLEL
jgi:ribonucleoside-diphosphate reductase beta chain